MYLICRVALEPAATLEGASVTGMQVWPRLSSLNCSGLMTVLKSLLDFGSVMRVSWGRWGGEEGEVFAFEVRDAQLDVVGFILDDECNPCVFYRLGLATCNSRI